jgi:hypothetical protein
MTDDTDTEAGSLTRPVDRVNPAAFMEILEAYAEDDRIESGVCRLELADGAERRLVIDEDLPALDDDAYAQREIAELIALFEESEDFEDRSVELTIPVADIDRVVAEAENLGSITTYFDVTGIRSLLAQLLEELASDEETTAPTESPSAAHSGSENA